MQVLKLFKSSAIYNDESHERRKLTKLSLVFSHMLSELRAFFQVFCNTINIIEYISLLF